MSLSRHLLIYGRCGRKHAIILSQGCQTDGHQGSLWLIRLALLPHHDALPRLLVLHRHYHLERVSMVTFIILVRHVCGLVLGE